MISGTLMESKPEPLIERLEKLGLACDHISLDEFTSATAALACFPMYIIVNSHLWSPVRNTSLLSRIPNTIAMLEAFEIGKQESSWEISEEHREVLGTMLSSPRPSDRIVYEYALETLKHLLNAAGAGLAETIRTEVARMIVAVANASGDGFLGTGVKISEDELFCIRWLNVELGLDQTEAGAWLINHTDPADPTTEVET
jgi:hypothetical protein